MGSEAGGGYLSRAYAGGLPPHAGGNGRAVPDAHRGRPLTFCPCRTGGSSRRDGCGGHSRVPPPTTGPPTDTATTGPPLPSPGTSPRYLPFRMKPPRPHRHRHRRLLMARHQTTCSLTNALPVLLDEWQEVPEVLGALTSSPA